MRAYRELQANVYAKDQTNSRKMQERISKSRFRAQGTEAETNVWGLQKQGKRKEIPKLDHFYVGFILQSTRL
jgi:hypothetical protein